MAIFRPGALVQVISGRVGGVEFATGRGAPTVRKAQHKIARSSPSTYSARAAYQQAAHDWQALSATDRQQWALTAQLIQRTNRVGYRRTPTAFNLYMQLAIPRILEALPIPTVPPLVPIAAQPTDLEITNDAAASLTVRLNGFTVALLSTITVWAGLNPNGEARKAPTAWRAVYHGTIGPTRSRNLIASWPADFTLPVAGWTVFLRAVNRGDGRIQSQPVYASTTLT